MSTAELVGVGVGWQYLCPPHTPHAGPPQREMSGAPVRAEQLQRLTAPGLCRVEAMLGSPSRHRGRDSPRQRLPCTCLQKEEKQRSSSGG